MHLDTYDEREMFSDAFPLLAAYPTVTAVASFAHTKVGHVRCRPGEAIRRVSIFDAWRHDNINIVRVPAEFVAAHAVETQRFATARPSRGTPSSGISPMNEYRVAAIAGMRGEVTFDAALWAHGVLRTDEQGMLRVIEQSRDWCAWAPMIRLAHVARDYDEWMGPAENRLRLVARRLLDASGLANVRVDDTLGNETSMQQAVCRTLAG